MQLYTFEKLKRGLPRSGIYCIFNTSNGRRYIGSSNNLWRRFMEHRRHLRSGSHRNSFLQRDYTKTGADFFTFFILQECPKEDRIALEQQWLDAVWDGGINCYNLESVAGSRITWKPSEETRKRMSLAKKGKSTGPCTLLRREAISEAKLGKAVNHTAEGKSRMVASKQKTYNVHLLSPSGVVYGPITNLHAFCREHQLDRSAILRLIGGRQGRVGKWTRLKGEK